MLLLATIEQNVSCDRIVDGIFSKGEDRMRIMDTVELLYLGLMYRWEKTAPDERHEGSLDGKPVRNTQVSRLVFLLQKIAAGNENQTYQKLARYTRRNDGNSYVSNDCSWMKEPSQLNGDWYFEGCMSLVQKQDVLQNLLKLGLSTTFVNCADSFVANQSVKKYFPTKEEYGQICLKIKDEEITPEIEEWLDSNGPVNQIVWACKPNCVTGI